MPASFNSRAFNDFKYYPDQGVVVKISDNSKLKNEALVYENARALRLDNFFVRDFLFSDEENSPFSLTLELCDYPDLGYKMIEEDFNKKEWKQIRDRIIFILKEFTKKQNKNFLPEQEKKDREAMFIDKTDFYFNQLIESFPLFKKLEEKNFIVNGENLNSFKELWPEAKKKIKEELVESDVPHSFVHGDLCFANILCSQNNQIIKLIDPRGSFGSDLIYGSPLYDVAKLLHSFEGCYEYIIADAWERIDYDFNKNGDFVLDYSFVNDNHKKIKNIFLEDEIFNHPLAKLVEGLIFIGMCSRHYDSGERQMVMYATGLKLIKEVLS